MPFQASWVEHWLDRYCEPGEHEYRAVRAGVSVCTRCGKQAISERETCLICGIPGEGPAEIASVRSPGLRRRGTLCGLCRDEFRERPAIRGWHLVRSA